mmetsp:Transcript_24841/g.49674  ORF Transcript_24841/g.49674 Transcript_24841/m.49674 type:complete len:127 (-) Transcript_24841:107-487(-)
MLSGGSVCNKKEELNRVQKKLTSVKDRLEQAEVLLKEFNEADDCRTEHLNDVMSMKACEFHDQRHTDLDRECGYHADTSELQHCDNWAQAAGDSKNTLIVNNWDYKCANWVYVVLSRVRTRNGLFL